MFACFRLGCFGFALFEWLLGLLVSMSLAFIVVLRGVFLMLLFG